MTVLSIPTRLGLAASALLLSVPLIAFETMIISQAPWWRPPYQEILTWSFGGFWLSLFLIIGLISAKKGAFLITSLLSGIWIIFSVWTAFRMRYPPLFFFTLFLGVVLPLILSWIKHELNQTFFDPQLSWYQGFPKPIPGLQCIVQAGEKSLELSVSRIDQVGVFIFSSSTPFAKPEIHSTFSTFLPRKKIQMTFNFRDRQLICFGNPILSIDRSIGMGVQFQSVTPDLRRDLGKFIEVLRVEGYV